MIINDSAEQEWLVQLANFLVDLENHAKAGRKLLYDYRRVGSEELPLKEVVRDTYSKALCNGVDPAAKVLRAIAARAKDIENHLEEDTSIYQDVKAWLLYEASLEEEE